MTRQYLIVRTVPKNPTVEDNYNLYLADTESEEPLGANKEDYDHDWGSYVNFGNAAREIADQIQKDRIKSVVLNLHSEAEPITDEQKQRLDKLVASALKEEFQWTRSYQKRRFGYRKTKH
jgi:hypothetical protein